MKDKKDNFIIFFAHATMILLISSLMSISVMPSIIGSVEGAGDKPKFDSTTLGKTCSELWDQIKADRAAGKDVTGKIELYEKACQDVYGGNPRLATETGVIGDRTGGITLNPNPTTEEPSKPTVTKKLPFGLKFAIPKLPSTELMPSASPPYKVKVTFTSVTVHNSHEGALSGDGEYDLSAYVHGQLVSLTDMSRKTGASGLWDVSSGETVRFPPGSEIVVNIDKTLPLSIFTVGSEVDGCDRTAFPANIQGKIVSALEKGVNYLIPLGNIQDELDKAINWVGCKLNPNDDIGDIIKSYDPTGYGSGQHTDKSHKGDFTLRYTITVTAPPASSATPLIK